MICTNSLRTFSKKKKSECNPTKIFSLQGYVLSQKQWYLLDLSIHLTLHRSLSPDNRRTKKKQIYLLTKTRICWGTDDIIEYLLSLKKVSLIREYSSIILMVRNYLIFFNFRVALGTCKWYFYYFVHSIFSQFLHFGSYLWGKSFQLPWSCTQTIRY